MRLISAIALILFFAARPAAAEPLFPRPLHLPRAIEDPLAGGVTLVDEYFSGDRAISVSGGITAIVDYGRQELTRIDRQRGTWSVARFDELARAARAAGPRSRSRTAAPWSVREAGSGSRGGVNVTIYRAAPSDDAGVALEIAIDRSVSLTRDALEVIAGAAWPSDPSPESAAILRAAAGDALRAAASAAGTAYGLPVETILTWTEGAAEVRFATRIVRAGSELAPPAVLDVPPGARRVVDPRLATAALLDELETSGTPQE